jgi:5-methylthioadenosine/S-adenosylhomocysteine deaminase
VITIIIFRMGDGITRGHGLPHPNSVLTAMQTLIQSVLTLRHQALEAVDVLLWGGHIHTVAPAGTIPRAAGQRLIDGQDKLLLPGFVNGHTHSSQVWQRGLIPQLPLELWLANVFDSTPKQLEQICIGGR